MLFGRVNLAAPSIPMHDAYKSATLSMLWRGCRSEEVESGGLWARVSFGKKAPLSVNDFIYDDENTGILVLVDGFIYNKREVLDRLGVSHQEISEPQLVSLAYYSLGNDFVELLNGDFAICIYEKKNNRLLLFRDHLGNRPLACAVTGSTAYFATDHMGLSKVLFDGDTVQRDYLVNMFMFEDMRYDVLPHKGVRKVMPGHYVEISNDGTTDHKYWKPENIDTDFSLTYRQVCADLEELIQDAVKIRVDDRFRAGAHLSGGLDSGLVAALVRKHYPAQAYFPAFSWSPGSPVKEDDLLHDERMLVKQVCEQHRMSPFFPDFSAADLIRATKSWRFQNEVVFELIVTREAAKNNINMLFSGWGGDEFVSIGNRGIDPDLVRNGDWRRFIEKNPVTKPRRFISAVLFNVFFPSLRRSYLKRKTFPEIYRYIRNSIGSNVIPRKNRISFGSRRDIHLFLLFDHHLAERTEDWYVLGQVCGIEYRYPLLDRRIVEYMLKVPSRSLVKGTGNRVVFREIAAKYLPGAVTANNSKDDPVKSRMFEKVLAEVINELVEEMVAFAENPDLAFIDFSLLGKDIRKYMASPDPTKKEEIAEMLLRIKAAHELTRVYYNQSEK